MLKREHGKYLLREGSQRVRRNYFKSMSSVDVLHTLLSFSLLLKTAGLLYEQNDNKEIMEEHRQKENYFSSKSLLSTFPSRFM